MLFFKKVNTLPVLYMLSILSNIYTAYYIYVHIYNIYFNNYIQVMKHRIYSFPRTAKGKQIHKQFTEGVLGAQATRAEPSEVRRQQQQQQTPSHPWLSTGMRMRN